MLQTASSSATSKSLSVALTSSKRTTQSWPSPWAKSCQAAVFGAMIRDLANVIAYGARIMTYASPVIYGPARIQRVIEGGRPLETAAPMADQRVIYDLRTKLSEAAVDLAQLREQYGEEWHEVKAARGQHEQLRLLLRAETETIRARIQSERDAKITEEQGLLQRARLLREESRSLAQRRRLYESLQAEVTANREFYDEFANRLTELSHYSRVNVTNARIIDKAMGYYPVSPNHPRNIMLGLVFGVALALAFALILERLSDQLRTLKEAVTVLNLPVLGVIPEQRGAEDVDLLAVRDSRSVYAESFRRARVQLNAVGAFPAEGCGVLMCASGVPREGKTLTSINLAIACAQAGRRTLLIDADLDRLERCLEPDPALGVSSRGRPSVRSPSIVSARSAGAASTRRSSALRPA